MWKWKRFLCMFLSLVILLSLSACGSSNQTTIDQCEWTLNTIQSDSDGGKVVACAVDYLASYPGAAEVDFSCAASEGAFVLTDHASGQVYSGTYTESTATGDSLLYTVQFDDSTGNATSALTKYADGGAAPTLVLSVDGYTMYFTGQ
ncbi:MAG: lactonase family protein [Clostridiales bacterium]|nr:lactonase family protein [Clostridiales bacterium]